MAVLLPPSEITGQTIASYQKQKNPVAFSSMVKKVTGRVKHLQDELAAESATNIEFEESSRRSFEFLSGQVKALKGAFNTLTDTLLEELEHMSASVRSEISRVDARQGELQRQLERQLEESLSGQRSLGDQLEKQCSAQCFAEKQLGETTARLERRFEQLAADLETVLGVVPKIEDAMLRGDGVLQEKVAAVSHEVDRVDDLVSAERSRLAATAERLDAKIKGASAELHEEIEQRHLKMQRGLTKQLESMSRVLLQETERLAGGEHSFAATIDRGDLDRSVSVPGLGHEGASLLGLGKPVRRRPAGRSGLGLGVDFDLSAVESPRLTPARTYSPRGFSSSLQAPGLASKLG